MQEKSISVFISYKYEDIQWKNKIKKWEEGGLLGPYVVVTGEEEDVRINGETAIKNHLSPKLLGMSVLLVLVGQDSHNRPWVDYEVQHAKSHHKKIIAVRIPGTTGATPVAIRELVLIPLDPNSLKKVLND